MQPTLEINGLQAVQNRLRDIFGQMPLVAGDAIRSEAEIEMTEAKHRTPVLTGALRASGMVTGPDVDANYVSVKMAFGGPAAPYAIEVHENLEALHKVGQAKFLESVLLESRNYIAERVAKRIRAFFGS